MVSALISSKDYTIDISCFLH